MIKITRMMITSTPMIAPITPLFMVYLLSWAARGRPVGDFP